MAHAYRIKAYNSKYIISGLTEGAEDYALININEDGTLNWQAKYGGTSSDHNFGMDIDTSGAIFLTGHTLSNTENWDTYTMKIDANGALLWESKEGNPRGFDPRYIHDETWDIKATNDGGCIIVAGLVMNMNLMMCTVLKRSPRQTSGWCILLSIMSLGKLNGNKSIKITKATIGQEKL